MKLYGTDLIKALSDVFAPSGCESEAARFIIEQIGDDASCRVDRVGNVIAEIPGGKDKTLICAHMDEAGFMVKDVDGDGKVRMNFFGGVPSERISGRTGIINGKTPCLFSAKPIHCLSGDERTKPTAADRIYAEMGTADKESAEKLVSIGDYGAFAPSFARIGKFIKGKALGSRASCAVLIEMIRKIKSENIPHENTLCFVFSAFGCVGNMGAEVAANEIAPKKGIVIDGISAVDLPDVPAEYVITKLDGGAVISYADAKTVYSRRLVDNALATAEKNGINHQLIMRQSQVGEGNVVQRALGGCECLGISIPVRYKNSASEMVSERDVNNVLSLAAALI